MNATPTMRQRKAFDKIIENHGNVSKSMREAGYPEITAKNPKNLTESKGFKMLCEEHGLTDELLVDSLVEDIKEKKGNRKAELELGFKVKGRLSEKQEDNRTLIINISGETAQRYGITPNTEDSSS